MNLEIITIGDELLSGHIVNTNAAWMGRELGEIGLSVRKATTVGDDAKALLATFRQAWNENDIVIVTGGLGPTHDDISKAAVSKFFRKKLVLHKPTLAAVRGWFAKLGYAKMPEVNVGQAMVPEDFIPLRNERGTAPGLLYYKGRKTFIILAGVPTEMEYIMKTGVLPFLKKNYKKHLVVIKHHTLITSGIGESVLVEKIGDPATFLREGTTLAFLPKPGAVRLRITSRGTTARAADREIARVEKTLRERVGVSIFGVDDETLEAAIVKLLTERGKTLSTAESCTGGLIASKLTDVPRASAVFLGSMVAYNDRIKTELLGVKQSVLEHDGAVSEETAKEMAEGALSALGTDFALGVSGIAGPDGGTAKKPVGTIWIALAERGAATTAKELQGDFGRHVNRERAAAAALDMLRKRLVR
jgi:nicotinamide-nucleotide amidase